MLWIWRDGDARSRAISVALAASAPLIWAGSDWAVTGDPLHSLHGTADLAVANDRRSLADVPYWTAKYFGYVLREPLVLGVPIGLVFAWLYARKRAVLPLAVVVAMVAVFAVGPLFRLPLIRRYIATPAVLLTLFYGLAVAGWTMLPRGRANRLDGRGRAGGPAVGRLPPVAVRPPGSRAGSTRTASSTATCRRWRRRRCARRSRPARTSRPATTARCPTRASGSTGPGRSSRPSSGASPMGKLLLMPVKGPTTRRIYPPKVFPKVKTRTASRRSTRTGRGA